MLLDFSVANFRSFREEQTLSMIASNASEHPDHCINTGVQAHGEELRLLRSGVIYGANASGKSNLIKAIDVWRDFVLTGHKLNQGEEIARVQPFRLDSNFSGKPSKFEVRLLLDGVIYRYGCSFTSADVHEEWLFQRNTTPRAREVLVFERIGGDPEKWKFGALIKGNRRVLRDQTRPNCLILSKAALENFEFARGIFGWFRNSVEIVDMVEFGREEIRYSVSRAVSLATDGDSLTKLVSVADGSIVKTRCEKVERKVPDDLRQLILSLGKEEFPETIIEPKVSFGRNTVQQERQVFFDFEDESNGIQRFFAIANLIVRAFREGRLVLIDELEASLHTLLAQEILRTINDDELNSTGAQFIIATHDSNLMDLDLLRRDQIFFTEKSNEGATELYSLFDFSPRPRNDSALEIQYLVGRFGGIPQLGNLRRAVEEALGEEAVI